MIANRHSIFRRNRRASAQGASYQERAVEPAARPGSAPAGKRVLDVTCVLLAAPVLIPLAVLIAAFIWCLSPGPVLFLQERVGYRGRRFICFKFRTMKVNADVGIHQRHVADLIRSTAPMVKMDDHGDPRLIPFGALLRAAGLDELPQLLNVVRGEMSLVGPRPCMGYEFEHYNQWQRRRFDTLPGLTGLWQVSGKNKTTFSEMIAMDLYYTETKSLWLDLKILMMTIPALLSQLKATRLPHQQKTLPFVELASSTSERARPCRCNSAG